MARQLQCSYCKELKWQESRCYRRNLERYEVETFDQLCEVYQCMKCRKCTRLLKTNQIYQTQAFMRFKEETQNIINEFIRRGWENPESQQWCKQSIEGFFNKHHIGPHEFKIITAGHVIKGFLLLSVPFWHKVYVEVIWKEREQL